MGENYLLDTNAVIEFLGGILPEPAIVWLEGIVAEDLHFLSVINQIELLGFNGEDEEMKTIEDFIGVSSVLSLSNEVVQQTIALRKEHKIKLPDAVIAATALTHDLTIITRNTSDFEDIDGIKYINPHEK
ncbi:MAG: type II toxin-antitoxin system VapC family toxin [Bacteroidota bacterium]